MENTTHACDISHQVDCTDAIQRVLKGEKPEKERRKRLVFQHR